MPDPPLPLPVAVHIGYRKTGSTWLQNVVFPAHPGLATVPDYPTSGEAVISDPLLRLLVVEPDRSFDPDVARRMLAEACSRVAREGVRLAVLSAERLAGHAASGGHDAVRTAHRLHAVVPEAKVFWFVRDQASAIRSEYKQLVVEGWTGSVTSTLSPERAWRTVTFDLGHWEYHHLAEVYRALFGPDRVAVFDHQLMRDRAASTLDGLAAFLEVAPWTSPEAMIDRSVNPSPSDAITRGTRVANLFRRSELNPHPPVVLPTGARTAIRRVVARLADAPLFPPAFEASMAERFRSSNERLLEVTGVDLLGGSERRRFSADLDLGVARAAARSSSSPTSRGAPGPPGPRGRRR